MKTYHILVAYDTDEGEDFIDWLNQQGHDAEFSKDTGDYIDGIWTSTDVEESQIMNQLWEDFCNS